MHASSSPTHLPTQLPVLGTLALTVTALAAFAPSPVLAQSGSEVLRTAMERYVERHEGIENYTLVQSVMDFENTTYFEREMIDGRPVFVPRTSEGSEAAERAPESPWTHFGEMEERAEHAGFETVDGVRAHVIRIDDPEGVDVWNPTPAGADFQPETLTLLIGEDDFLIREIRMTGTVTAQGAPQDASFNASFLDYREVDGLTHPFRTVIAAEGLQGQMSEEEMASMREMMEQMENMPEAQRQMMRQMMGDQFEQIERMLTEGAMDITVEVTEIRVNSDPPGGA